MEHDSTVTFFSLQAIKRMGFILRDTSSNIFRVTSVHAFITHFFFQLILFSFFFLETWTSEYSRNKETIRTHFIIPHQLLI